MKNKREIVACSVGNFLEWYDFALYGLVAIHLTPIFFPSDQGLKSIMSALMVYAIGFVMRPLGSIIFGWIGDEWGRRKALILSVVLITIPTFAIAVLPTYAQAGLTATVLLVIFRIMQGIPMGGELPSTMCYLYEISPKNEKGFYSSWVYVGSQLGYLACIVEIYLLQRGLPSHDFQQWGWRMSFLFGALLGVLGFFLRRRIGETKTFTLLAKEKRLVSNPLISTFKTQKLNLFIGFILSALPLGGFFIMSVFFSIYLSEMMGLGFTTGLLVNGAFLLLSTLLLPLMGVLGDRWGILRLFKWSAITTVIFGFAEFHYGHRHNLAGVIVVHTGLVTSLTMNAAYIPYLIAHLFPPQIRTTSMGLSYNISNAILGGTAPLICLMLVEREGGHMGPAYYIMFLAFLTLLGALACEFRPTFRREAGHLPPQQ